MIDFIRKRLAEGLANETAAHFVQWYSRSVSVTTHCNAAGSWDHPLTLIDVTCNVAIILRNRNLIHRYGFRRLTISFAGGNYRWYRSGFQFSPARLVQYWWLFSLRQEKNKYCRVVSLRAGLITTVVSGKIGDKTPSIRGKILMNVEVVISVYALLFVVNWLDR